MWSERSFNNSLRLYGRSKCGHFYVPRRKSFKQWKPFCTRYHILIVKIKSNVGITRSKYINYILVRGVKCIDGRDVLASHCSFIFLSSLAFSPTVSVAVATARRQRHLVIVNQSRLSDVLPYLAEFINKCYCNLEGCWMDQRRGRRVAILKNIRFF